MEPGRPESSYTDKEVYQFITLPGFSTNKKVTEFSGRGVGMDVVVSNLQKDRRYVRDRQRTRSGKYNEFKDPIDTCHY